MGYDVKGCSDCWLSVLCTADAYADSHMLPPWSEEWLKAKASGNLKGIIAINGIRVMPARNSRIDGRASISSGIIFKDQSHWKNMR